MVHFSLGSKFRKVIEKTSENQHRLNKPQDSLDTVKETASHSITIQAALAFMIYFFSFFLQLTFTLFNFIISTQKVTDDHIHKGTFFNIYT
jgi:hypothetical protein